MRMIATTIASVFCIAVLATFAEADIVISGDVNAGTGQLTISHDITYHITAADSVFWVVFDEWTTSDGDNNVSQIQFGGENSVFAYNINGGATETSGASLNDNASGPLGVLTANDGFVVLGTNPGVVANDTYTVLAGTYDLSASPGGNFNPALNNSSFNGNTFLAGSSATRISDFGVSIPEPATGTIGLAALVFGLIGRRRRTS